MSDDSAPGHNSVAAEQIKSIIERVERLDAERKELAADIRDVFAEAKGNGLDVKAIKAIIKMRSEDPDKRAEREAILSLYMDALGSFIELPLGAAAMDRVRGRGP